MSHTLDAGPETGSVKKVKYEDINGIFYCRWGEEALTFPPFLRCLGWLLCMLGKLIILRLYE